MSSLKWVSVVLLGAVGISCVTSHKKPCTEGGQSSRDTLTPFRGTKRCLQTRDQSGAFVNDGKYFEWYPNDKIALQGEYKMGKRIGRWVEYDEKGAKVSDKYYDEGKEVPRP